MTKPPKYYNQVRIPTGDNKTPLKITKSMSQKQCCKLFAYNDLCSKEYKKRFIIECMHCMFDKTNIHHWKQWKKETFKGVKRCKKVRKHDN